MMLMQFVLTFPFPNIQQWWWNKNKKCLHENFAPLAHHCGHLLQVRVKVHPINKGPKASRDYAPTLSSSIRSTSRCCVANQAQRMLNMLRTILCRYWCHRREYHRAFTCAICNMPSLFLPWMHSEDSRSEGYIKLWRWARVEDFVLLLFSGG